MKLNTLISDVDNQKPRKKDDDMSEQICDICKKEPARVYIKGQGQYCLKCYNMMALKKSGTDDAYNYPEIVTVREADGKLHIFHVEHMVMGDTVSWEAFEQKGNYWKNLNVPMHGNKNCRINGIYAYGKYN